MAQRFLSSLMVLWFALFTSIGTHFFLDDIGMTTATSERVYIGNPVFIMLDVLCVVVCAGGVAAFMYLFWQGARPQPF
jgi:hypothetical protein